MDSVPKRKHSCKCRSRAGQFSVGVLSTWSIISFTTGIFRSAKSRPRFRRDCSSVDPPPGSEATSAGPDSWALELGTATKTRQWVARSRLSRAPTITPFSALFEGNAYAISWLRASSAVFCHYNRRPDRIGSAPPEVSAPDGPSERAVGAAQHSASAGPTLLRVGEC